ARDRIRRLLAGVPDLDVVGEAGDVPSAVELIDRERPHLCVLGVQMPGGGGFDVLRPVAPAPRVVFTTALRPYSLRAFEVRSLDYLLKPVHGDRLREAVERARREAGAPVPGKDVLRLLEEIRAGLPATPETGARGTAAPKRVPAKRGSKILLLDPAEVA